MFTCWLAVTDESTSQSDDSSLHRVPQARNERDLLVVLFELLDALIERRIVQSILQVQL